MVKNLNEKKNNTLKAFHVTISLFQSKYIFNWSGKKLSLSEAGYIIQISQITQEMKFFNGDKFIDSYCLILDS